MLVVVLLSSTTTFFETNYDFIGVVLQEEQQSANVVPLPRHRRAKTGK